MNYLQLPINDKINYKIYCKWYYSYNVNNSFMRFIILDNFWIDPYWYY